MFDSPTGLGAHGTVIAQHDHVEQQTERSKLVFLPFAVMLPQLGREQ
jgi:hypothetical protein